MWFNGCTCWNFPCRNLRFGLGRSGGTSSTGSYGGPAFQPFQEMTNSRCDDWQLDDLCAFNFVYTKKKVYNLLDIIYYMCLINNHKDQHGLTSGWCTSGRCTSGFPASCVRVPAGILMIFQRLCHFKSQKFLQVSFLIYNWCKACKAMYPPIRRKRTYCIL